MHPPPVGRSPEEWIEQLILYLVHAGVLPDAAHLRLVSPEPEWLRQDPFTQARALFTRWLDGHVEDLRQTHHDLGLWMDRSLLASGRVLLTDLLRRCKPGEWYSIDSLLRAAAGLRPHFLRERDRILRQQGYRGLKQMLTSWFTVEGTALLMHLTGIPFEIGWWRWVIPTTGGTRERARSSSPIGARRCLASRHGQRRRARGTRSSFSPTSRWW